MTDSTKTTTKVSRKIARQNAVQKIWPLMGYELRTKLTQGEQA